jgi:chloramphenicol-sensitive protein RarD
MRDVLRQPKVLGAFALSALLLAANWLTYVWAVHHGHVVDASLGYFILPLVNVGLGFVFLHERPRSGQWVAVAVAACGVLWLTVQAGRVPWIALILAVTFGFYGLLRKVAALGALEGLALETMVLAPVTLAVLGWWALQGQGRTGAGRCGHPGLAHAGRPGDGHSPAVVCRGRAPHTTGDHGHPAIHLAQHAVAAGVWWFGEPFDAGRMLGFGLIWTALLLYSLEAGATCAALQSRDMTRGVDRRATVNTEASFGE